MSTSSLDFSTPSSGSEHTKRPIALIIALSVTAVLLLAAALLAVPLRGILMGQTPLASHPAAFNPGDGNLDTTAIGVYLYPEDALSPIAKRLGQGGVRWTRLWLDWNLVEPTPADPPIYHWDYPDKLLSAARNAGMETVLVFGVNARWASDTACGPIYPEAQAAYQAFLSAAAERYSAAPYNIHVWEIYNEPDSAFGAQGYCFGTRGQEYATSLRLAYEAIKAVDPQATVLFGGISYDFFTSEGGSFDPEFLDDALSAGAGPYFDALAFHYYPAFAERWEPYGSGVAGKAAYLRSELARYGLDKPLALTEIGRPTRGPASDDISYSENETARFVAPALALARAADLAPIIWFSAVDKPREPYDYGLFSARGKPEASFRVYQAVLPAVQDSEYLGELPVNGNGKALRFAARAGEAIVAWAEQGAAEMTIDAPFVWQVDRNGARQRIADGSRRDLDRLTNGSLRVRLTRDPVVLWLP